METIRLYIENLFASLPKSQQADRLRTNLLHDSEERFADLITNGHSEAEALGMVIQQFGNFDDIRNQLGVSQIDTEHAAKNQAMADEYKSFRKRYTIGIAGGVLLCILGVVSGGLADAFDLGEAMTIMGFFIPISIAVAIFTYFGMQQARYTNYFRANKMYEYLDEESYEKAKHLDQTAPFMSAAQSHESRERRERNERLSGALWVLAIAIFLGLGFFGGWWHPGWVVFLIATAVQILIV